jgi:multisubunit Na+/H+ antiporter MnhF subunit
MALTTLSTQLNSRLVTALLSMALTTLSAQLNSTQAVSKRLVIALLSPAVTISFAGCEYVKE